MKKRIGFPLLLLLVGSVGLDTARSLEGGVSADEQTVRSLDDQERVAVLNRNYSALEHLWCDQFTVNAPNNQVVTGRRDVLALVQRIARFSSFERRIEFFRIDGDLAIVMGAETVKPNGDVPLAGETVERRFTHIWKKDGETWCVIARHANVRPAVSQ